MDLNKKPIRVIPKLDIKGSNVVKGVQMEGLRVVGEPEELANLYYNNGADELFFTDIVASLYGRNALLDVISRMSKNIFVPLTVGGGLRTLKDIYMVLRSGADKVSINSQAIKNPKFIAEAVKEFGSSTITITIETNLYNKSNYVFYNNGRDSTKLNPLNWAKECIDRGAGEIFLYSILKDGTGSGFDIEMIKNFNKQINVPIIIGGGAGTSLDLENLSKIDFISGVALSSILHYSNLKKGKDKDFNSKKDGNFEYLKKNKKNNKFEKMNIKKIKKILSNNFTTTY
jgi:cyclase|tara:strand:+ start:286 stop:1143 length:858 start_codon:yes stop_codon:yes gene_type:complete